MINKGIILDYKVILSIIKDYCGKFSKIIFYVYNING